MRVVMLTTSWPRSDADMAGRFLVPQVEQLEHAGAHVRVLAPGRDYNDYGLTGSPGVVANARRRPWRLPLMLASMVRALRRAARDADVIHAHWLLVAPVAALGGRPLVLSLHGSGSAGRFSDLELARRHPRIFRWLVSRARVVIGVSPALADAAANAGATATLIPHGVELPADDRVVDHAAQAASGAAPIALWAGRLSAEKGVDVLAEAFGTDPTAAAPATSGISGVELVVAGDGPLRSLVPGALGFVAHADLLDLYARASMLVMPSHSEGFGVVALEAMATGVPVIATRVGGLAWLVQDDVTGIVIEPGDAAALRAAVERLRDDAALRARLGAGARARTREEFGWDGVTRRTLDAYEKAIRSSV